MYGFYRWIMILEGRALVKRELKLLFQLKKTERLWHIPVLASLCVGMPLLIGYYLGHLE